MKNKLLLTILIFIIFATCTYSQTCGTQFSEKRIEDLKSFYEKHDFSLSYKNKTVIPVTIWKGVEYIWSFNDYKIFELIDQANEQLAPANIELFAWENNVRVVEGHSITATYITYLPSGCFVEGTLNIYFTGETNGFAGLMKGNLLDAKQYDAIFISPEKYHITTIAHEVGHYLGLFHTFGTRNYSAGNRSVTDEKVDGSNCLQAGDFICDTRADPGNNINSSCTYICSTSSSNNCNKEPGTNQPYTPDTKNLMSYFHECRSLFSPQQISIMNAYASSNRNFQIPTSGCERDSNEPSYGYPSYEYSVGLGDNWVSFPPLVFTKTVTGKYDNLWDSDLYFMNLQGGNRSYKISVISDIPAILKIFRAGVAFSNSEHLILPGVTNVIYNNIPGEGHRKSFEIRPTITPGCGSTYTITIENYNENCNDENEPNNTKQSSTSLGELINIGQSLNTSGLIETSYDVDFYSFNMKAKGKYEMTLESDAVDFDFSYIDENNIEFKSHIKNGVGTELWVVENKKNTPITGYIKVQTKGTLSSCLSRYNLKVQVIEKPVDIVCNPDVYEPNNLFGSIEGPTFIGNDQSSSKVFHANIHDPYDIDIYKVLLNKRGTISITLTDMPIQYSMFAGHRIGVPDDEDYYIPIVEASISNTPTVAKIVYEKLDNNPYTFYFDIYNLLNNFDVRCTDYKVTIEWTPKNESAECFDVTYEPNSSPSTSSIIFGTLDNESKQIEINPKIGSVGDYDYFKVKLVKNGNLKLNVFSDNYPVRIELSKDGYNFFKSKNSTGSNDPNINPLTYDFLTGSDETLYLRAYSPGNQFNCNHTYSLLLDWAPVNTVDGSSAGSCIDALAEPNDTFSNANDGFFKFNEISQSQNGEFFISSPSDLDFFKIITKYKGLMDVVLSNLPVDLDFEVFDENFNLIGISKNSFISSEKLTFVSNASVYYIKVVGKNKQFDCINKYTLNVNWQRELDCNDFLNNDISSAIQLAKLSHIPKDTVISNHKISRFGEKDYFRLTNKSTGTLHVVLSEGALDYDIYLIDKNENILAKSARYTSSDEFYYFQSNPDEELYIYIEAKGFKFDCSENYIFSLDWTPQVENPVQNEYPCNSVISPDVAFDLDGNPYGRVWSGNLSSGQSNISNYYCGSGSYGKELVFEFYYDPKPGQELDITLWKMKNPGLDFYLLDGCDPTISFCYGKVESEYWSFLGYYRASSRFRDLETNKKYYIFVDGVLENEEFEIEISIRDPWVIWEDPDTGCGIPRPLFNYQCVGGKYNVIMDLTGVNVKSLTSPTHIVTKLSNSVYKINNVSSEDVYFKVNYVSSKGFSCVADFVIPKYICNINVDNCFGLNPPVVPSKIEVCPENDLPTINVYNPEGYKIEWYDSAQGSTPVFTGNNFIPDTFGTYFIKFSDTIKFCQSDRLPIIIEKISEIVFSHEISNNKCYGDNNGRIELLFSNINDDYEIYWNNGQIGSINDRLLAGLYSATLFDKNQCKVQRSFRITEPDKLYFSNEKIENNIINLCKDETAVINNSVSGGIPPYNFLQNNEPAQEIIQMSENGRYIFTAYDENLCAINRQVIIKKSIELPIDFVLDTLDNKIFLTCLAFYENSGTWSTGEKTPTIEVNQSGEYAVEIIGEYNCVYSKSINVSILSSEIDIDKLSITLFPNPADNYLNIKCNSCNLNESAVEIRSIDGLLCLKSPYQFNQELDISHLNPGIYTVSLNIANFIVHNKLIVLK